MPRPRTRLNGARGARPGRPRRTRRHAQTARGCTQAPTARPGLLVPGSPCLCRSFGPRQKSVVDVVLVDVVVADEAVELDEVDVLVVLVVVVSQSTSGASTSWQSPHRLQFWR